MIWVLIVGCWAISFLFAGIEAGLLALNPVRLRHRAKNGERAARRLQRMLRHPERLLVTVLLATNAADIVALLLLTRILVSKFGEVGYGASLAIALPVYLFLLGVLPKSLFRRFPFRALARLCGLLEAATTLLLPLHLAGEWITRSWFTRGQTTRRLFAGREELKMITMQSERGGEISSTERAIIHNVVDFTSVRVRDVMVPLAKTITISPAAAISDVLRLSETSGVDRFPVLDHRGQALGMVNVFDIIFDQAPQAIARGYVRRMISTQETEEANGAVRRLRAARTGLAAVRNQRRELVGVVALEDLVRHLVRG